MSEWDTTALLSDIKERGSLPDNDLRFTSTLILSAATKELREGVAPLLSNSRSEHLVYPYTQPVVSGTSHYRMPPRAVGGTLRDVAFIDTSDRAIRLNQLSADQIEQIGRTDNQGTPYAYWLQGYKVVLVGIPNVSGTLSTPYYARPNMLIATSTAVVIEAVEDIGGGYYRVSATKTTTSTALFNGTTADVVRSTPGFETLAEAALLNNPDEPTPGTLTVDIPMGEAPDVGDYVCVAGQSPVPQVPVELFGLLACRTARRLLKAVGDDRWEAMAADVQELEDKAKAWLAPRVSGDTQQAGGDVGTGLVGGMGWAFGWY